MGNDAGRLFFAERPVEQIGIVVRDRERALRSTTGRWGGSRWVCYTYGPQMLRAQTFRGEASTFRMRLALNDQTPQIELIEPVDGPSLYHEWLEQHGEGIHHLGFFVPSIERTMAEMEALGHPVIQSGVGSGLDGDGGFAYFDLTAELGVIVEAIERPARRRQPEAVWERGAERPTAAG